jgi:hypothetical protein
MEQGGFHARELVDERKLGKAPLKGRALATQKIEKVLGGEEDKWTMTHGIQQIQCQRCTSAN